MLRFQFFPRSVGMSPYLEKVARCFTKNFDKIDSEKNNLHSNEVLAILRSGLEELDFYVETGKKDSDKIKVPVLFSLNNEVDKFFNADALSKDGQIVIEIEAGRAVDNNQFLKDIFQASMMYSVEYLVLAVRKKYRRKDDFELIFKFLETMYISNRIKLPLQGILLIGY